MMTQRAKLRRLAFIGLPSWSRGSRPHSLGSFIGQAPRKPSGSAALQSRCRPGRCQGNHADYLTHVSAIPVQIMAVKPAFSGVVKTPKRFAAVFEPASSRTAARRRRLDTNSTIDQADQRAGEGLFQPWAVPCIVLGGGQVQCRQQGFDFAKFCRSLMTDPINYALQ